MDSTISNESDPIIIRTERLVLRLADPASIPDCNALIHLYQTYAFPGGNTIDSIADARLKHKLHGPKAKFCTKGIVPYGMMFLVYLANLPNSTSNPDGPCGQDGVEQPIGHVGLSFRPDGPCPDLGYAMLSSFQGQGYAAEAGREVLKFWRETIGVERIYASTAPFNVASHRLAERIGLVKHGGINVIIGSGADEQTVEAVVFMLPGMEEGWEEGWTIKVNLGKDGEAEKVEDMNVEDPEGML